MKESKSRGAASISKARPAPKTVEEYLARVPASSRSAFGKLRAAVRSAVPRDAVETISYGIPAFKQKGVVVWFAAFRTHCSLFPTAAVIADFKNELKDFSTSKGTIHFPLYRPIPTVLVKRLVKARVAQQQRRKSG